MNESRTGPLLLVSTSLVLGYAPVHAAGPPADAVLGEVVVTASRVGREGFSAPTPTTVISEEQIQARAATTIIDVINDLPAFRNTQTQQAQANGAGAGGNQVDLRGLGTIRTLLLVNGHRHVATNANGTVDLNLIPNSLVQRTEVVTGGASAAWGSDAIAGVVNLILKNDLQGLQSNLAYGQSSKNDFSETSVSLSGGTAFAGGRGHFMAGGEFNDNKGLPIVEKARDWSRQLWFSFNPTPRAAGAPNQILADNVGFSDLLNKRGVIVGAAASAANGNFNSLPLDNLLFLSGGGTAPMVLGSSVGGNLMQGGQNDGINLNTGAYVVNPVRRYSGLTRVSYDLSDATNVYAEATLAQVNFSGLGPQRRDQANLRIYGNNAFLRAAMPGNATVNAMTATQSFVIGRLLEEPGHMKQSTKQKTGSAVIGVDGKFGSTGKWGAYLQHGENRTDTRNQQTNQGNFNAAMDAIGSSPATAVCNPTPRLGVTNATVLLTPDPGCVPLNLFGEGSPSQAALDYVLGYATNVIRIKQDVGAVNLSGEPFSIPTGPVSLAGGFEYRKESIDSSPDAVSVASGWLAGNQQPIRGAFNVKEAYLETVVPLAKNRLLLKSLDLNAAARRTDYSTSGAVTTWKAGLSYEPVGSIRVRATKSRDIRSANVNELFASANVGNGNVGYSVGTTQVIANAIRPTVSVGNPDLRPEVADTLTAGIILTPAFAPGFRTSIDYYRIDISDVISSLGGQTILNQCFNGGAVPSGNYYCSLVQFGPGNTTVVQITNPVLNLNGLKTDGVDLEMAYNHPSLGSLPGRLTTRLLTTYVHEYESVDTVNPGPTDTVGVTMPQWVWNLVFNYSVGKFTADLQIRYLNATHRSATIVGPDDPQYSEIVNLPGNNSIVRNGVVVTSASTTNDNTNSGAKYVSLSGQYKMIDDGTKNLTLYAVANNLFDQDPPPFTNNAQGGVAYDLVGRRIRVGVRFSY